MKIENTTQKLILKMLKRKKPFSEALKYDLVGEELGITSRQVRYLASGEKVGSESLQKLIKLMAQ